MKGRVSPAFRRVSSSGGACLFSVSSRGVAFRQAEGRFVERSSVSCREEGLFERSSVLSRGGALRREE